VIIYDGDGSYAHWEIKGLDSASVSSSDSVSISLDDSAMYLQTSSISDYPAAFCTMTAMNP
jgi:hypothetical protein